MKKILAALLLLPFATFAADKDSTANNFKFTILKENKITSVKDQASSGTCWSFSGLGFFEAELLRMGKPEVDLSEMFVVHHSFSDKATKFVRMNGMVNYGGGGSFYDVVYVLQNYGIVPEEAMNGLNYGEDRHKHAELDKLTEAYVKVIVSNPNKKLSTAWKNGFTGILNAYLGTPPQEFTVGNKKFTPLSYRESLGLNMNDYVSLTSFTHHPFYTKFALEIPDNWRNSESYNIPLNEFKAVIDNAVDKGFTVAWATDVSEKGFTRNGIAVNPETKLTNLPGSDQARWLNISQKEMEEKIYKDLKPQPEVKVTQETRQAGFDNYQTTDDHGMLIYGTANDQNGTKYYLVKNSWGTSNTYKGLWYASESFVLDKTINILVHKDAIPAVIFRKLKM